MLTDWAKGLPIASPKFKKGLPIIYPKIIPLRNGLPI